MGVIVAQQYKPDIVLLDINLPGMDGFEVLRELRATPETRRIPIVALTANATAREIQRGRDAGLDGYLTKPIQIEELLTTLSQFLKDRSLAERF
jgi:CheY-like chemotaxis protein